MQLDDLAPQIVPLPAPPAWERYLLESPVVVLATLGIGAVVALLILNARGRARLGLLISGALVVVAFGVWALAASVVTERELLIARARGLIDATARADVAAIRPMLAERAGVRVGDQTRATTREQILGLVEEYPGGVAIIESHSIAEAQAVIDGERTARTQVRVKHTGPGLPIASWWLIEWRRDEPESPWIVESIEPLWIAGYGNL